MNDKSILSVGSFKAHFKPDILHTLDSKRTDLPIVREKNIMLQHLTFRVRVRVNNKSYFVYQLK